MSTRFLFASLATALLLAPAVAGPRHPAAPDAAEAAVSIEVRFISVADDFFERIGVNFSSEGNKIKAEIIENSQTPTFLDDKQLRKFLEAVEGDIRSNVMQAPKMVVSDGKVANIRCARQLSYVTGMNAVRQGESLVVCPKSEIISTGFELSAQPKITADNRAIAVRLQASLTNLDCEKVPLFPVAVPVTPMSKDSKPEKPVSFTQYIQQPQFNTLALMGEMTIPDGGTVLLGGWKRVSEGRCEFGPPVLSKIPYANRLFKSTGYTRSVEKVFVMVTATIIRTEAKKAAAASACPKKAVAELMKQFNVLFKEGKYAEAEVCALRTHELDPDNPIAAAAVRIARQQRVSHASSSEADVSTGIVPCAVRKPADCPSTRENKKEAAKLVEMYHAACSTGRLDEARQLAHQALELDPTCFDKPSR